MYIFKANTRRCNPFREYLFLIWSRVLKGRSPFRRMRQLRRYIAGGYTNFYRHMTVINNREIASVIGRHMYIHGVFLTDEIVIYRKRYRVNIIYSLEMPLRLYSVFDGVITMHRADICVDIVLLYHISNGTYQLRLEPRATLLPF